jgi:glycosyltransferase involved in cell wall biosynthesis
MRVCLLPTDTWGVGSYRCLLPGRELDRRGHEVFAFLDVERQQQLAGHGGNAPFANVLPDLEGGLVPDDFDADVYVFQRRFEFGVPTTILRLRKAGKAVVVETDDLYDDLPESSPAWKVLREHPQRVGVDAFNAGCMVADLVTVSTPALAEHYSRYNPRVRVLPNFLDWEQWSQVKPQCDVERPDGRIRVGWMGWIGWRDRDLDVLRKWLPDWLLKHPDAVFVSIGEKPGGAEVQRYLGLPKRQCATVAGVPFPHLQRIVPTIDIGLVPLTLNAFNECKSWLKGLEYAACGIPCIATPTEQYRQLVEPGVNGLHATTPAEWEQALDLLVSDDDLRRTMGRAARAKAATLTIQEHAHLWEDAYAGLVDRDIRSAPSRASAAA